MVTNVDENVDKEWGIDAGYWILVAGSLRLPPETSKQKPATAY